MTILCTLFGACALAGLATVHDGDTLRVQGQSIRLYGVDAEELNEPNGYRARDVLIEIVRDTQITCTPEGKSYNRIVAICVTLAGTDVGAEVIRRGAALDCAHYSHGMYRSVEPPDARSKLLQKPYC